MSENKLLEVEDNDTTRYGLSAYYRENHRWWSHSANVFLPKPRPKVLLKLKANDQLFKDAIGMAQKGARVLWVCNTVKMAQAAYQQLKDLKKWVRDWLATLTLSSLYSARARRILDEPFRQNGQSNWRLHSGINANRRTKRWYWCWYINQWISPSDMLLQRIGRLWRHLDVRLPSMRPYSRTWILAAARRKIARWIKTVSALKIKQTLGD